MAVVHTKSTSTRAVHRQVATCICYCMSMATLNKSMMLKVSFSYDFVYVCVCVCHIVGSEDNNTSHMQVHWPDRILHQENLLALSAHYPSSWGSAHGRLS